MRHGIIPVVLLVLGSFVSVAHSGDGRVLSGAVSSGLSLGLPLGLPPAPANELVLASAPDDAAAFVHWSSLQPPKVAGGNRTEQLLAHRDVQAFLDYVKTNILRAANASANDPMSKAAVTSAAQSIETLLTHETAVYARFNGGPAGGFVCDLGESAQAIESMMLGLAKMVGEDVRVTESESGRIFAINKQPIPPVKFAIANRLLVLGVGDGEFEAIQARLKQPKVADWLTAARKRASIQRISNLTYVNADRFDTFFGDADLGIPREFAALGVDGFRAMTCVTGLSDDSVTVRSWFDVDPALQQRLEAVAGKITAKDISDTALDATVMATLKLNLDAVTDEVMKALDVIEPGASDEFQGEFRQELGLDLREDILAGLSGHVQIYESPREGGRLFTGWTAVVQMRDEAKIKSLQARFVAMVDDPRAPFAIKTRKYLGEKVSYLVFRDDAPGFTPAWCLSKGRLIVAAYPQSIYGLLGRLPMPPVDKTIQAIEEQDTSIFLKVRESTVAQLVYPFFYIAASFLPDQLDRDIQEVIDIDPGMLPPLTAITDHLGDATVSVDFSDGIEIVRHQTLPPIGIPAVVGSGVIGESIDNVFDDEYEDVIAAPPSAVAPPEDQSSVLDLKMDDGNAASQLATLQLKDVTADANLGIDSAAGMVWAMQQAKKLADEGKRDQAIYEYLRLCLHEKDGRINARYELGTLYYDTQRYSDAMETFSECIKIAPSDYRGYLGRGKTNWIQDKDEESLPDFRKASSLDPKAYEPWLYLGLAHRSLGQSPSSIPYLTKAISLNPEQWYAFYSRGNSYYDSDNYEKAIADYTKSLELRGSGNKSYYWRAHAYHEMGDTDKAITDMSAFLRESPLDEDALESRAEMYEDAGKSVWAIRDYHALVGLKPNSADALKGRGGVWMSLEKYDIAITDYTRAIELDPDQWAFANRALCWDKKGEIDKTIADYSSAIKLDPKYLFALNQRASKYMNSDRFSLAKSDYMAAIAAGSGDDHFTLGNFSWLLAACPDASVRDGKLSLEYATKASEMTKWKEAWIIDNVAAAYAELGEYPKAIEYAQRAIAVSESEAERDDILGRLKRYQQNKPAIWK